MLYRALVAFGLHTGYSEDFLHRCSVWTLLESVKTNPPVTNFGFGYILSITVIAMIGLISFTFVARQYKYREGDDRPYY